MKKRTFLLCALAVWLGTFSVLADTPAHNISAESAILMEAESGDIIYEKNAHERLPIASTTKIMTALVALEHLPLDRIVKIPPAACGVEGSSVYLEENEELSVSDLLYAMMLESANDAATALALEVSGSVDDFSALMNEKAHEIGLTDTHFTNPHGLYDEMHYSTAADMARLTAVALQNEDFARLVSTYKTQIPLRGDEGIRVLINHNKLLKKSDRVIGVKTGFTKKSGRCLVSAAEENGVRVIAVTLNAPDDWNDHLTLHELGLNAYESVTLAEEGALTLDIPAVGAEDGLLSVANNEKVTVTLPKGTSYTSVVIAPHLIYTSVYEGEEAASVKYYANGKEIASVPLYAVETVIVPEKQGFFDKIFNFFR